MMCAFRNSGTLMPLRYTMQDQDTLLAWAAPRCDVAFLEFPEPSIALGAYDADTGAIRAVAVYVQFYEGEVDCHFASDGSRQWARREGLREMFAYPFFRMGARRIQTTVAAHDIDTLVLCIKTGWQIEGRIRAAMPNDDGILLTMLRGECPWLEGE